MKLLFLAVALSVSIARAEDVVFDIKLAGSKVGENTYSVSANGDFKSTSSLKLGTVTINSSLEGHWKGDRLASFTLTEKSGANTGRVHWDGKTVDTELNGKVQQIGKPFTPTTQAFFTNFHPCLTVTLLAQRIAAKKPEFEVIVADGLVPVKSKFDLEDRTAMVAGKATPLTMLKGAFAGVGMEMAFEGTAFVALDVPSQQFKIERRGYDGVFEDPLAKYPELSQPTYKVVHEERVKAPLRDGVVLVSDVARPNDSGRFPVILIRTPYGRAASLIGMDKYAERGYVVVSQDVRGRGASGGGWDPFNTEIADGKDTLDWLVKQPWCDGNVGMIGGSYLGMVQWSAAVTHHPALKCIIPQVSPPEPTRNVPWDNGAFLLTGAVWWSRIVMDREANMAAVGESLTGLKKLRTLPLTKVDDQFLGRNIPFYDTWLRRPNRADWKGAFTTTQVGQVKIPVMHVSGVWDGDGVGTMLHWQALRANKGNQWLVFGPWDHGFNSKSKFGDQDYGSGAILELDSLYLRFFDTHLKGRAAKLDKEPRVRFFVTGANKWLHVADWPPAGAKAVTYRLGGGKANSVKSKGSLGNAPGLVDDSIKYDPLHPAFDQNSIEVDPSKAVTTAMPKDLGNGTLLYRSAPFSKPTTLGGPLKAELFVSTTARDATLFLQVFDEDPKGKFQAFAMQGARRVGFVDGKLSPIQPKNVYKILLEPWLFARRFAKGHRFVIVVRADMFPGFARNPGTGEPDATATKLIPATHTVHKRGAYTSKVTLWEIPE